MQAGDRKLCGGYRGKDDMQEEETCEFLNGNAEPYEKIFVSR